ncbi:MAG: flagellar hook-associated protein FlgK [Firmicutes bacterium]|nr:flagellar hook-associated protein FlgK [Bacillota bacterium]
MRSTFAGINTMVRGLNTSQLQLDTVGHNITNADTTGYSRQTANTVATPSQTIYGSSGTLQVGTGVDTKSITRARDIYADRQYWQENSNTEYNKAKQTSYDSIEAIFDENDSSGLSTVLSAFWKDCKNLSTNASDYSTRVVLRDAGKELVTKIQDSTSQLQDAITNNNDSIKLKVESVNQLTSAIYDLNKQIVRAEATGGTANDMRDSRDALVDKLSALVNVSVTEKNNGSYSITSNGNTLVDEDGHTDLDTTTTANNDYGVQDITIIVKSTGTTYSATSGELKGLQDSTTEAKSYIDNLTTMSSYLLTTFNTAHKAGYGIDSSETTGLNFFCGTSGSTTDYSSLAYNSTSGTWQMTVSGVTTDVNRTDILNNYLNVNSDFDATGGTDLIAAKTAKKSTTSGTSTGQDTASGDNATILGNLIGSTASTMLGNVTLTSYYSGVMGKLGVDAQAVDRKVTTQDAIMTQVENSRESTAGVNTNEELTNMIKFQQGYSASSRCLTTMDEMLDKLINSTGTVGR